jgi:peptidoglycan/xylan/chitin deacetylase (PgdA/CDA1 family)
MAPRRRCHKTCGEAEEDMNVKTRAILAYHEVMPESSYSYCVTCSTFTEHLRLLRSQGNSGLPAQITFDDGEQSQHRYALPLLAEHGISATFFVTPGLIGTEAKSLGWDQLREVSAAGHSIQSHGWSHKFLTLCSRQELVHELRASKESLEDHIGRVVQGISVPGGRWNRQVAKAAAWAGYEQLYVSDPWIDTEVCGVQVVGRFMVRRTTSVVDLKKILERDPRMLWTLRMRSEVKKRVVSLIGDGVYHRLWCRLTGYSEFEEARQSQYS